RKRLRPYFGNILVQQVSKEIPKYIASRLAETKKTRTKKKAQVSTGKKFANASINRELAYIKRSLKLGSRQTPPLVLHVPHITMLKESDNVRQGVLPHENY